MNLDDRNTINKLDPQNMQAEIDGLPKQLENAWQLGGSHDLPTWEGVQQVILAGMGGSAIGADLLAAYLDRQSRLPIIVHRDYDLPHWANGSGTLVIACSHSGNTEETLSAYQAALAGRGLSPSLSNYVRQRLTAIQP